MRTTFKAALVIKPKQPFIDWVHSLPWNFDPEPRVQGTVFLVPLEFGLQIQDDKLKEEFVTGNYQFFFERELAFWSPDVDDLVDDLDESQWTNSYKNFWPHIDLETFNEWFVVEYSEIVDVVEADDFTIDCEPEGNKFRFYLMPGVDESEKGVKPDFKYDDIENRRAAKYRCN